MPSTASTFTSYRPDLAGAFMEFDLMADRLGFIGHRLYPTLPVAVAGGQFPKVTIESLLSGADAVKRAPGAAFPQRHWTFTKDTFSCDDYGVEETYDDGERQMYADMFDMDLVCLQRAMDFILRSGESRILTDVLGNSNTSSASTVWSTHATAKPVTNVQTAKENVWGRTGLWPNCVAMSRKAYNNLIRCDEFTDIVHSSGAGRSISPGDIDTSTVANVLDVNYVLVAGAAKNTANEADDVSISSIFTNTKAWVGVVAEDNDIRRPCIGRTFKWNRIYRLATGEGIDATVERYFSQERDSEVIRCRHDVDEKELYEDCGEVITGVLS